MTAPELNDPRLPARFWEKIAPDENGCWLWTAYLDPRGYGRYTQDGGRVLAHRVAYALLVGTIPPGLSLDHLCRVRRCVNPAHLEPVTLRVNTLRGETIPARNAARTACQNGHPFDEANTYRFVRAGTWRRGCRACNRIHVARRYARLRSTPTLGLPADTTDPNR